MKTLGALRSLVRAFGPKPKYLGLFLFRVAIQCSMVLFLLLDRLLLPGLRSVPLERPVFLIGHLRSGTTFLHRYLVANCPELRGMYMWEMLCPSVTGRWLLRPLRPLLGRISLDAVYDPAIHRTGLLEAETDDIAIAFRFSDGLLSWIYNDAWAGSSSGSIAEQVRESSRSRAFPVYLRRIYRGLVPRSGGRMLSKSFFALFGVQHIQELFPDSRILLLIRDPAEAVPSMLSLQRSVQGALNDHESNPELASRYCENLYRASLAYYEEFHRVATEHGDRVTVITHRQLLGQFEETFLRVCEAIDVELTPSLRGAIAQQVARQAGHRSRHDYEPEQFGLTRERIASDFAFVYEHYDV